ncbi:hypothetical protein C2G38_2092049 [Gigaspora rosea]|uniref:Uncharacterized protein n=1 Tax=Gigaspora rosea TaxID=44941 RepID=A0A397V300_9GLOM|nr:hypothetical protein C2G38_2092049 [Gigaspora rosea]
MEIWVVCADDPYSCVLYCPGFIQNKSRPKLFVTQSLRLIDEDYVKLKFASDPNNYSVANNNRVPP